MIAAKLNTIDYISLEKWLYKCCFKKLHYCDVFTI